ARRDRADSDSRTGSRRRQREAQNVTTDNPKLLVGRYLADTISMGPGLRAVVWVAGCSINCKGCATPELIGKERGVWRTVEEVGEWLARDKASYGIEGVSF